MPKHPHSVTDLVAHAKKRCPHLSDAEHQKIAHTALQVLSEKAWVQAGINPETAIKLAAHRHRHRSPIG